MTKFQKKTIPVSKKLISYLLVFALLVQAFIVTVAVPTNVLAASAEAKVMTSAVDSGIAYITTKNLSYYGDRTYKLSLTATSSIREAHETGIRTSSEDGYITADAAGYYLLELYGADGGNGASTSQGGEGVGGNGGYAYGYVWLNEGDTLVYTIGTIGETEIYAGENGSGENNEEGNHGDDGAYAVGAGGGYSAIYLIPAEKSYQPEGGSVISESDRKNYYIMIAGGGGGGGAGNAALYPSTGNADGGAGGTVAAGSGIPLTAEENGGVAGTYYSGKDGSTSGYKALGIDGTSYAYVGKGGTNVPGVAPEVLLGYNATNPAQDWANGGSGGNGNYRGGGGGAGFAGGSGGIMEGALFAYNVGGGGGGSSFIADTVEVFDVNSVSNDLHSLLQGPDGNDNASGTGGKAIITYLGVDPETKAFTGHLEDVTINGTISEYFDILSVSVDNGTGVGSFNKDTNEVTVTGADITPDELGYEDADNFCRVDIIIKAKTDFFGGNKVPVLKEGTNFTLTTADAYYSKGDKQFDPMTFYFGGEKDGNGAEYDDSADYCNVSLNLTASANSYSYSLNNIPNPFIGAENLYKDNYTNYRSNMNQFASEYLDTISNYQVALREGNGDILYPNRPTATGRWFYTVSFTVTPKVKAANAAIVGPVVPDTNTISDTAVIIVLEAGKVAVGNDGAELSVDKLLSYDGGTDQYKLQVSVTGDYETTAPYEKYYYRSSSDYDASIEQGQLTNTTNKYEVQVTGWYAIGAHGGQGGDGHGSANIYDFIIKVAQYNEGGWGAFGDDVTGYIYLEKGDVLTWYVGSDKMEWKNDFYTPGDDGCYSPFDSNRKGTSGGNNNKGTGGLGGEASWIAVNGVPVIIAAGGPGGGGGYSWSTSSGANGLSNTDSSRANWAGINSSYAGSIAAYNGGNGQNGGDPGQNNAAAGDLKDSYRSDLVKTYISVNGTTLSNFESTFANNFPTTTNWVCNCTKYNGASGPVDFKEAGVMISLVAADVNYFDGLQLTADFERYFDLNSINYNNTALTNSEYAANRGGSDNNGTKVTGLSPSYTVNNTTTTSGNTATVKVTLPELKYEFYLTPKDGFIGGNDVPLLNENNGIEIYVPYDYANGNAFKAVAAKNETDYANVAIKYEFDTENFVTKEGIRIDCGDEIGSIDDLLETDIIPAPAPGEEWKWDYATALTAKQVYERELANGGTPIGGALYETTPYLLKQIIEPKAAAAKAIVVSNVTPVEADNHVTVTVVRPVHELLQNATIVYDTSVDGVETEGTGADETVKVTTEADLSGTIVADKGYDLPDDITVYVCGTEMTSGYSYSPTSGAFTIPASAVRALVANDGLHSQLDSALEEEHQHVIVISADATEQTLTLSFVWWELDEENPGAYIEHTGFDDEFLAYLSKVAGSEVSVALPASNSNQFVTGAPLTDDDWFKQFLALDHIDLGDKEFKWIWGTEDYTALTEMPGANTKIPGYVADKYYTVNVHYVEEGVHETDLIASTQVMGPLGHYVFVTSPEIEGYLPVNASTKVTIEKDDSGNLITDVYVEYVRAANELLVYHVYGDTNEQIKAETIEISSSGSQSVRVEDIDHYTPYYNGDKVNGGTVNIDITDEDIANGKAVYIYYQPDRYTLTFDLNANGAAFKPGDKDQRTVQYNNSLGYDADEQKNVQFPQPERKGYTFLGWFTTEDIVEEEKAVTESASVNPYADDGDITLYAHWEAIKYKVIVNYVFLDKDGQVMDSTNKYYPADAADEEESEWGYEEEYTSEIPAFTGFELESVTPDTDDNTAMLAKRISGTMPAVKLEYTVTYKQLTYKLTINFEWDELVDDQSADLPDLPETKEVYLVYNEDYSYTREALEGDLAEDLADYNAYYDSDLELPIEGTMGTDEITITVYYTDSISFELEWGDLQFTMIVDYDTDVHDYIGNEINPSSEGSDLIKVTNNGSRELPVSFEYGAETLYSDIRAGFTIDEEETAETTVAGNGGSATAALSLTLPEDGYGVYENVLSQGAVSFTSGTVTVTIGEADVENGSDQD